MELLSVLLEIGGNIGHGLAGIGAGVAAIAAGMGIGRIGDLHWKQWLVSQKQLVTFVRT